MVVCGHCGAIIECEDDLTNIIINDLLDDEEIESEEAYGYYAECAECNSVVIDYVDERQMTMQEVIDEDDEECDGNCEQCEYCEKQE